MSKLLTVHGSLAARIIATIKGSLDSNSTHHYLLVGPQGSGKSQLLSCIYHRLLDQQSLNHQLKIAWLAKDSNITGYNALLLQLIATLDRAYPRQPLTTKLEQLRDLPGSQQQHFAEQLILNMIGQQTTLLIIKENVDDLLVNIGVDGQHKLRALIQNQPQFCLLGSTTRLTHASGDEPPFYGFFHIQHLKKLRFRH